MIKAFDTNIFVLLISKALAFWQAYPKHNLGLLLQAWRIYPMKTVNR